jgi:hypothetical protein
LFSLDEDRHWPSCIIGPGKIQWSFRLLGIEIPNVKSANECARHGKEAIIADNARYPRWHYHLTDPVKCFIYLSDDPLAIVEHENQLPNSLLGSAGCYPTQKNMENFCTANRWTLFSSYPGLTSAPG